MAQTGAKRKQWRADVLERDDYTCIDCRRRFPESQLDADHDIETTDGGSDDLGNGVTRCKTDHARKTEERRMARAGVKKPPAKKGEERIQTAQLPDRPDGRRHAAAVAPAAIIGFGAYLSTTALGYDYGTIIGGVVASFAGLVLLVFVLRWFHWQRLSESQRVFERLATPLKLPYAARRTHFKVKSWAWLTPASAVVKGGQGFDPTPTALDGLALRFAVAVGAQPSEGRAHQMTRGRIQLWLEDRQPERAQVPASSAQAAQESVRAPDDQDIIVTRTQNALAAVVDDDAQAQITAWHTDGAPRVVVLDYPSRATKAARTARADLPVVLGDLFPPHGRWAITWEPGEDRFVCTDEPDPLAPLVPLAPIEDDLDLVAGPILGVTEDGRPWRQPILGDSLLVAGIKGAGKGSVLWGIVRALSLLIADGRCLLYVSDPKGGMEFTKLKAIAHRFALRDGTKKMLEQAVADMQAQAERLATAGMRKLEVPTRENPLRLVIVDELANFAGDKEVNALIGTLLQQGRAPGTVVVGALQDARVKAIDNRDLFGSAIAMLLRARNQVDMVLGPGMRAEGALCDRIPRSLPGVGYVVTEDHPEPVRVRAAFVDDDEIARITTPPAQPPAHSVRTTGVQLALPVRDDVRGGEPVTVGEVLSAETTVAARKIPPMFDATDTVRAILPDDKDPVTILAAERRGDRVRVTYDYGDGVGERDHEFDDSELVTLL